MLIGLAIVGVASILGLLVAYYFDFSLGPAVAMSLGILLVIAAFAGKFAKPSRST
jgi:glycerol-3-phosphate acyltransferase PlsY